MYRVYEVKNEENIDIIAQTHFLETEMLRKINGFDLNYEVRSGELIVLPSGMKQLFSVYVVNEGDTLHEISARFGLNQSVLAKINGLDLDEYIYPKQELIIPREGFSVYITNEGETIGDIEQILNKRFDTLLPNNKNLEIVRDQLIIYEKEK